MALEISKDNLKHGLLGLVIALVEIIKDALKLQALARMEDGSLEEREIERLGRALLEFGPAIFAERSVVITKTRPSVYRRLRGLSAAKVKFLHNSHR